MAELRVSPVTLRLRRAPIQAAWGELHERELLRVEVVAEDGVAGVGEAAPLEPYDGVPLAAVRAALDAYARVLAGHRLDGAPELPPPAPDCTRGSSLEHEELLAACRAERDLPHALAAVDLALWDLAGRRAGRPVAALLHTRPAARVAVNATLGAEDRAGAAAQAAAAVAAGYTCLKLKVGVGDDAGRVAAVRAAAGREVLLRVDANGAWATPAEAIENLRALAPAGLEYAEEPVHGVEPLRAVRGASPVPVAMDETHAPGAGAADAVCLKVGRSGGISGLLADAAAARAAGSAVYLASAFDGPAGVAAALHAAAALGAESELPACGLATLGAFAAPDPWPPEAGAMRVPDGPGLM